MNITATQLPITGINKPDNQNYPGRNAVNEKPEEQSEAQSGKIIFADGAEEAAEQLVYDQPSPKQSRAIYAYRDVAMQERRSEIQQMVSVDLYA